MKQMCRKKYPSPRSCRNERPNPRCFTVSVNSTEPRLQTTVRHLGLKVLSGMNGVMDTNILGYVICILTSWYIVS